MTALMYYISSGSNNTKVFWMRYVRNKIFLKYSSTRLFEHVKQYWSDALYNIEVVCLSIKSNSLRYRYTILVHDLIRVPLVTTLKNFLLSSVPLQSLSRSGCITTLRCMWEMNMLKKNIFYAILLVHSVAKSAHHQTSSFFSLFFELRKQVEQVISFYIHFSSSHFFVVVVFFVYFISYPTKMNNIQHIYWKVIYVHAPLHKCVTILSNQWRFIYVVGIISRLYIEIQINQNVQRKLVQL